MARSIFVIGIPEAGPFTSSPGLGLNLKDISQIIFAPPAQPAAPVAPPAPPKDTVLGMPPTVAALGGVGILGTLAALIFGHK